jgi:hypothetical protein
MDKAYVYAVRVDGIVRYIGKGTGRRLNAHMKIVRSMARRRAAGESVIAVSMFYDKLFRAYVAGSTIDHEILCDGLSNADAYRTEIEVKKGFEAAQLWNAGKPWDREDYRARQRTRWADPDVKEYHRQKVVDAQRHPQRVERNSARLKSAWADPEKRAALHVGIKKFRASVFDKTVLGSLLAFVRNNPGLSFTEIRNGFQDHKKGSVANSLRRLRDRGLVTKDEGKHGVYYASNIIELKRIGT